MGSNITITWALIGVQEEHMELGLTTTQRPPKIIVVIDADVDLTKKCQTWVVATVQNGVYKFYIRNYSYVFRTYSDPFSIYNTISTPNSGGNTEDNLVRNATIIASVIGGIATILGAIITARLFICKCCKPNNNDDDANMA